MTAYSPGCNHKHSAAVSWSHCLSYNLRQKLSNNRFSIIPFQNGSGLNLIALYKGRKNIQSSLEFLPHYKRSQINLLCNIIILPDTKLLKMGLDLPVLTHRIIKNVSTVCCSIKLLLLTDLYILSQLASQYTTIRTYYIRVSRQGYLIRLTYGNTYTIYNTIISQ